MMREVALAVGQVLALMRELVLQGSGATLDCHLEGWGENLIARSNKCLCSFCVQCTATGLDLKAPK